MIVFHIIYIKSVLRKAVIFNLLAANSVFPAAICNTSTALLRFVAYGIIALMA